MSKKASQSSDWDFPVVPCQLLLPTPAGNMPSKVWANVAACHNGDMNVVGLVSEKGYGLIQNKDFVTTVRTALDALGLTGYTENIITLHQGRQLYATYEFDTRIKSLSKVNDQVGLVLRFANSFDGTLAALGELRAKILRCLNGMCLEKGQFALQKRHNPQISLDFVKQVTEKAVNDFDKALAVFDRLADVALSDEQGINLLGHTGFSKRLAEKIGNIWITPSFTESKARTLYALYDAVTQYLSHEVETNRFEMAAKMNRMALRVIASALDPSVFAQVTKPVVVEVESEIVEN